MKKYRPSLLLLAAAGLLASLQITSAQSISWGSAVGQRCVDSKATNVGTDWKFELGTFTDGFIPTAENITLWTENWTALDKADYNAEAGFFSSRATVKRPELAGHQAFIWIYNQQSYRPSTEWVLMTDRDGEDGNDWVIPTVSNEPVARPKNWRVSGASTVIIGGANSLVGCGERNKIAKGDKSHGFQAYRLPETVVAAAKKRRERSEEVKIPVVALLEKVLVLKKEIFE